MLEGVGVLKSLERLSFGPVVLIHMQEVRAQSRKPTCVGQASIIECGDLEIVVWKFNRVAHSADNWLNGDVDHCQSLKLSDLSFFAVDHRFPIFPDSRPSAASPNT
jgi:hypothetical protein